MLAYDIYDRAMKLLGYNDASGSIEGDEGLKKRALTVINLVLEDLKTGAFADTLLCELDINERAAEAAVYGVCMFITLSGSDSAKNPLFTDIYNSKRASYLSGTARIKEGGAIIGGVQGYEV